MKRQSLIRYSAIAAIIFASSGSSFANEPDPFKRKAVEEFVEISMEDPTMKQFLTFLSSQFVLEMKRRNPNLNEKAALDIVQNEVRRAVKEASGEAMAKYYNDSDIVDIVRFLKSPAGEKYRNMSVSIGQETLANAKRISPEVMRRIDSALEKSSLAIAPGK